MDIKLDNDFALGPYEDLVSILLPVLKPDLLLLKEAIDSILAQEHKNFELIIVEAPSEVTGEDVVKNYGDPRIRYVLNQERSSLRDQLNQAIALSRGDFLARMDADDISRPERLKKQLQYLKAHPEISLVGTNMEFIDEKGRSLGYRRFPEEHDVIARDLRVYCSIAHPTVMFRKADVIEIGCYKDSQPMEDWDLWCRMLLAGKQFHNIQEPLFKYRVHSQAGKVTVMKKTLRTGIDLKKRHFRYGKGTWGVREALRCFLEECLILIPSKIVLKLFILVTTRKTH